MPQIFTAGILPPSAVQGVIPNEVFGIAINWFAPRTPLLARLPKVMDGNAIFQMIGHQFRPRHLTIGATGLVDTTGTSLLLVDASSTMAGDVFSLPSGEYVEVVSDPTVSGGTVNNTLTIRRGVGGTTAATQAAAGVITLVGNSRTGAEDFPQAIQSSLTSKTQYMQTIEHPYSVGGAVQTNVAYPLVPGAQTPLAQYKMDSMQNAMDDCEISAYLGKGEASTAATTGRAKMFGLRSLIQTNFTAAPTNASAYGPVDFQRDLLTTPRTNGGYPDVVVVASNWMTAFTMWGQPLQKLDAGETVFGTPIRTYAAPFIGDVEIWESSLLTPYTAFSLTQQEARWRIKRPMIDEPFGKTGDNTKGHMLAELAIELDNEQHHAWVEGVTAFAATG